MQEFFVVRFEAVVACLELKADSALKLFLCGTAYAMNLHA